MNSKHIGFLPLIIQFLANYQPITLATVFFFFLNECMYAPQQLGLRLDNIL